MGAMTINCPLNKINHITLYNIRNFPKPKPNTQKIKNSFWVYMSVSKF